MAGRSPSQPAPYTAPPVCLALLEPVCHSLILTPMTWSSAVYPHFTCTRMINHQVCLGAHKKSQSHCILGILECGKAKVICQFSDLHGHAERSREALCICSRVLVNGKLCVQVPTTLSTCEAIYLERTPSFLLPRVSSQEYTIYLCRQDSFLGAG